MSTADAPERGGASTSTSSNTEKVIFDDGSTAAAAAAAAAAAPKLQSSGSSEKGTGSTTTKMSISGGRSSGSTSSTGSSSSISNRSKDTSALPTETAAHLELTPSRERANTAPPLAEGAALQQPPTQPQQQKTQQQTQETITTATEARKPIERKQSDEDEDIRIAKAMAMAIANNPNLPPEEIRELVGGPKSIISSSSNKANTSSSLGASFSNLGGGGGSGPQMISSRLTSMFQDFDKVIKGSVVGVTGTTASSAQAAASSNTSTSGLSASFRIGDNLLRKYVGGNASSMTGGGNTLTTTVVTTEPDPFLSGLEAPSTNNLSSSASTITTTNTTFVVSPSSSPLPESPTRSLSVVAAAMPAAAASLLASSASIISSSSGQQQQQQKQNSTTTAAKTASSTLSEVASTKTTTTVTKTKTALPSGEKLPKDPVVYVGGGGSVPSATTSTSNKSSKSVTISAASSSTAEAATPAAASTIITTSNNNNNAAPPLPLSRSSSGPAAVSSSSPGAPPPSTAAVLNFLPTSFRTSYAAGNLLNIATSTATPSNNKPSGSNRSLGAKSCPIRLSTLAWKRRGGMGKYSTLAWELRRIELVGNRILYYRNDADGDDVGVGGGENGQSFRSNESDNNNDPGNGPEGIVVVGKRAKWLEQAAASWATIDPTSPRGYIDLAKEKATASATLGHSGAPSPFAISIKVRGETKWKLCFDYHKTQMEWLAAITDVAVQASVDAYNANLLVAADPSNAAAENTFSFPPAANGDRSSAADQQPNRLWMLEPYVIESGGIEKVVESDDEESKFEGTECNTFDDDGPELVMSTPDVVSSSTGAIAPTAMVETGEVVVPDHSVARETAKMEADTTWYIPERNLLYLRAFVNAALFYARSSSTSLEGFWYLVVVTNLGLLLASIQEPKWESILEYVRYAPTIITSTLVPATSNTGMVAKAGDGKVGKIEQKVHVLLGSVPVAPVPSKLSFLPLAGSTTVRVKTPIDPPVNSKNQVFAGWRPCEPELMLVRSHGYLATKAKVPSPGELYEAVQVDVFESQQRYPDIGTRVKLPEAKFLDKGAKTWHMPDIFVVSIALPTDPPKFGRTTSDGGGYTVIAYFRMRQETRDILRRVTADGYDATQEEVPADPQLSLVNAVRLMEEWCRRAPTDPKYQARFKVVPNAHNLEEIGMPTWISKYNGKPFLVKRAGQTGFLFSHPEISCMEFDVSLHPFPYLAKQAICFMKESYFKRILVSFGFCIEGRSDDELPECLIGAMQLCYPDPDVAIQASDLFAGRASSSFD